MKIRIKSEKEIRELKEGGKILAEALRQVVERIKNRNGGAVSAWELDKLAEKTIRKYGAEPSFLGYPAGENEEPYPASLCVSLNHEIVHGLPLKGRFVKEGDIVKLDLGVMYKGLYTDAAITVALGKIDPNKEKLIKTTRRSLEIGIEQIYPGARLGDYGSAVERYALRNGFAVVRGLVGHGVGHEVHESPQIPNFGKVGEGIRLKEGMVLALEPMVNEGAENLVMSDNGFAFETMDGSVSAHFEHTVAVSKDGVDVITQHDIIEIII